MSDSRQSQHRALREHNGDDKRERPLVLYVPTDGEDEHSSSVPATLEAEHGMDVSVVPTLQAVQTRLRDQTTPGTCVVKEDSPGDSGDKILSAEFRDHHPEIPFLVYAVDTSPEDCQAYLDAGIDDCVMETADTEQCGLLAHRIEQAIALARERTKARQFETTIDHMGHGVLIADPDGQIEYVNRAFEALGYTPLELEGRHLKVLQAAVEDTDRYREFWETVTDGNAWEGELRIANEGGEDYPTLLTAVPLRDERGAVSRIVVVGDDIAERKAHEQELQEARQRYRAFIDGAPDAIFVADTDTGEIIEVNEAAADLLERPAHEIIGMDQSELHPLEERDRYRDLFERHIDAGEAILDSLDNGDPIYIETSHGDQIPVEINAKVIDLADRTLMQGHFRDISERRERERELRSFREAVEHAGHAIMMTDPDGQIQYVNPAFEEITGYSETKALGERPSILKSGEHDHTFYQDLWETILSGEVWHGELVNERKNGERYYIDQTIAPITTDNGDIERFVAVNTDITERKQYEDRLERERDRLDEFATTIAHDLRNPLSVALGNIDTLYQRRTKSIEGMEPSEIMICLERSLTALERMETMIDEVLTLSKQGYTVSDPECISFDDLVEKAWKTTDTADATLVIDDESMMADWTLKCDPSRVSELLENLFRNAIEHAGSDVTIQIGSLGHHDGFYVEDDGPGIAPEKRNRVFESGFTTDQDGTGFGLAIVKQIVDAHGWDISITEASTGGARFEIATPPTQTVTLQEGIQSE